MVPLRVEARACTYVRIGPRANGSEPTLSTSALVYKLHRRRDLVPVKVCHMIGFCDTTEERGLPAKK